VAICEQYWRVRRFCNSNKFLGQLVICHLWQHSLHPHLRNALSSQATTLASS